MFTNCAFAEPGTFGHECGKPAVLVGARSSDMTTSGTFYLRRCEACAKQVGGENTGVTKWEQFNPAVHVNTFK